MGTRAVLGGDVTPTPGAEATLAQAVGGRTADIGLWQLDAAYPAAPAEGATPLAFRAQDVAAARMATTQVVSLATNHVTDFGSAGVRATAEALCDVGMFPVGAGADRMAADAPLFIDLPEGRLAILAMAEEHPRCGAKAARAGHPGASPFELPSAVARVRDARGRADWVWVALHWGEEYVSLPDPMQRLCARALVEAGACLVVGSHAHVPQGREDREGGSIFYGLGNLWFPPYRDPAGYDYLWHPMTRRGLVVSGELRDGAWRWEPRGVWLGDDGWPAPGAVACPDWGDGFWARPGVYERVQPWMRRRDLLRHKAERLWFMAPAERRHRLRDVIGRGR